MASFRYKAMTENGSILSGVLEAPSAAAVVQQLRGQGHYPISTKPAATGSLFERLSAVVSSRKPSLTALRNAITELAALIEAGLELDRALTLLCRLSDIGALAGPFERVRNRVRDGSTFANALARENIFPPFVVSMVRAGEYGGALAPALQRLSDYLARTVQLRETIGSALVYPAILIVTASISVSIILLFVLPEFKPLFEQAGKAIPLPARIVMGIGDFARETWWLAIILVVSTIYGARVWLSKPPNRLRFDRFLLEVPVIGKLVQAQGTERFSRTLGTLLANGVPLPTALALTSDVMQNRVLGEVVGKAAHSLREGTSLARLLGESRRFPDVTVDLVRIGEETGKLPDMLLRQAELDEHRLRQTIDRLVALIVPALTIVLGIVIAGLIASMLVAILSINDLAVQ